MLNIKVKKYHIKKNIAEYHSKKKSQWFQTFKTSNNKKNKIKTKHLLKERTNNYLFINANKQQKKKLFKKYKWAKKKKKNNNNLLFGYISMTSAGFLVIQSI